MRHSKHMFKKYIWFIFASLILAGCATASSTTNTKVERGFGESVSDSALNTRIKTRLVKNSEINAGKIDVDVYKGEVTLNGEVFSNHEKATAIRVTKETPGVRKVISRLRVVQGR